MPDEKPETMPAEMPAHHRSSEAEGVPPVQEGPEDLSAKRSEICRDQVTRPTTPMPSDSAEDSEICRGQVTRPTTPMPSDSSEDSETDRIPETCPATPEQSSDSAEVPEFVRKQIQSLSALVQKQLEYDQDHLDRMSNFVQNQLGGIVSLLQECPATSPVLGQEGPMKQMPVEKQLEPPVENQRTDKLSVLEFLQTYNVPEESDVQFLCSVSSEEAENPLADPRSSGVGKTPNKNNNRLLRLKTQNRYLRQQLQETRKLFATQREEMSKAADQMRDIFESLIRGTTDRIRICDENFCVTQQ